MSTMQQRFHELSRLKSDAEARMKPALDRYDFLRKQQQAIDAQLKPISDELRQLRAPIFDIDQERASIARALNGLTGKPS